MENILKLPKDRKIILATHSGSFHADEVFASVVLSEILTKNDFSFEIIRTRDEDVIKKADIVYDVGGIYDSESLRFDHHQTPSPLGRMDVPYSSFGLIWKHFGLELCEGNSEVWSDIDRRVVLPVDATDNGIETYKIAKEGVSPILFQDIASIFNVTWNETIDKNKQNALFFEFLSIAKSYLNRAMTVAYQNYEGRILVRAEYEKADNKKLIVLDTSLPWEEELSSREDTLVVVYPSEKDNGEISWHVKSVKKDPLGFERRCQILPDFIGLSGDELVSASGIKDAVFCHKTGYICVTKTKEAAVEVARRTVDAVISHK